MSTRIQDLASTLVGMEPLDLDDEDEGEVRAPKRFEPVRRPRAANEPTFLPEPPRTVEATGLTCARSLSGS